MSSLLEVGVGQNPYFFRFEDHCSADEYVALDKCAKCLDVAKKRAEEHASRFKVPEARSFITGNATDLPFPDGSFDRIILSNVISAPIHKDWDIHSPEYLNSGFGEKDAFYRERLRLIEEVLRVLLPGGRMRIYTDLVIYGQHSYENILSHLKNAPGLGFHVLPHEQMRVDALNIRRISAGDRSHAFIAEVLPRSSVFEIVKLKRMA